MRYRLKLCLFLILSLIILAGCTVDPGSDNKDAYHEEVTSINDLDATNYFRNGALEHILEGEVNTKGQAVGFHYDRLPTKKGEIIPGTKTDPNQEGVYEAEITINGVEKAGNNGKSSFFPDDWDTQEVIDAINDAYENKVHINGNTYDGLANDGVHIRMYLDNNEKIISAFPIY